MVTAVVEGSIDTGDLVMDTEIAEVMAELREFMFGRVYLRPDTAIHRGRARDIVHGLVHYFETHPDEVPDTYAHTNSPPLVRAIDYVAGMTDRFAVRTFESLP